jgi:hypothetical protein
VIGCALTALGWPTAAATAGASSPADTVELAAAGKSLDVVKDGTEVRVIATEKGTIPLGQRPALLQILGGYQVKGQTQANVLRKCSGKRCEIDPAIRTPTTWTYRAFLVGKSGTVLAESRIVKVEWIRRGSTATEP